MIPVQFVSSILVVGRQLFFMGRYYLNISLDLNVCVEFCRDRKGSVIPFTNPEMLQNSLASPYDRLFVYRVWKITFKNATPQEAKKQRIADVLHAGADVKRTAETGNAYLNTVYDVMKGSVDARGIQGSKALEEHIKSEILFF